MKCTDYNSSGFKIGFKSSDLKTLNLSEEGVGVGWLSVGGESEVGELSDITEGAGEGASGSGHGVTVAGLVDDGSEGREIDGEGVVSVGNWDLEVVVVWGKGEVSDEVGSALGGSLVDAGDGDVGLSSAGGVVEVSISIVGLWEEGEDLNGGTLEDTFERGEGRAGSPEDTTDGDEGSGETTEGDGAGGVDWGVTGIDGGDGTAGLDIVLSLPFGGGGLEVKCQNRYIENFYFFKYFFSLLLTKAARVAAIFILKSLRRV